MASNLNKRSNKIKKEIKRKKKKESVEKKNQQQNRMNHQILVITHDFIGRAILLKNTN
jgi:F0F1-type ATP synthase assembly protein I